MLGHEYRDRIGTINNLLKGTQHVITPSAPPVVQYAGT